MELILPPEATLELYYEAVAFIDMVLQTWLTVTFAAIVALYVAVPIRRLLRALITGLYATSAFVLLGRFLMASLHSHYYRRAFDVYEASPFTASEQIVNLVGPSLFFLMLFGSIATTVYLATFDRKEGD